MTITNLEISAEVLFGEGESKLVSQEFEHTKLLQY